MSRLLYRDLNVPPPTAVSARGLRIQLSDGREILDGSSGAAVSCLGHSHEYVVEAMRVQAEILDYAHTGLYTNEPAEALAEKIVGSSGGAFERALFVSSGSEAMELALKVARQFFVECGEGGRTHVISRRQSYHGATLNALAAGGHVARRRYYNPLFSSSYSRVSPCFAYHYQQAGESDVEYVLRLSRELESEILRVGSDRVIAFCAETVVGAAAGCVTAVPGYFKAIREVCDRYGVLLILDEIMCGLGRTGTMHAWDNEGVRPDIQAVAKGLAGGHQPLGGVLVSKRVVEVIENGSGLVGHGQTYQCHPIACAAGLAVQEVMEKDNLLAKVRRDGEYLGRELERRFRAHPLVGDIRGRGLFWALEIVRDKDNKLAFPRSLSISDKIREATFRAGLATYPSAGTIDGEIGDHVMIAPPFIVSTNDMDEIVERLGRGLEDVAEQVTAC